MDCIIWQECDLQDTYETQGENSLENLHTYEKGDA